MVVCLTTVLSYLPKQRVQGIKELHVIKAVQVEDGLENIDMPFRGDEGNRRNSEIKTWEKILGKKETDQKSFQETR